MGQEDKMEKEVNLINLGLMRALGNQQITACHITGTRGYGPNNKSLRMVESLVDLNNQLFAKSTNTDPLADLRVALGAAPLNAPAPPPNKSDIRLVKLEKNFAALNKSVEAIADALPK